MKSMHRALITAAAVGLVGVTTGCLDDSVTGTRPLSLTLSADVTTATVGQTVTVSFEATGTGLAEVSIDFRDGEVDTFDYFGPIEVAGFSAHAYTAAGTYVVRGEMVAVEGTLADSIEITVN